MLKILRSTTPLLRMINLIYKPGMETTAGQHEVIEIKPNSKAFRFLIKLHISQDMMITSNPN